MNLIEFFERFPDEDACIRHLEQLVWGNDPIICPYCSAKKQDKMMYSLGVYKNCYKTRTYICNRCDNLFDVRVNTFFNDSKVVLKKWFLIILFMQHEKNCDKKTFALIAKLINLKQGTIYEMYCIILREATKNPFFMKHFFAKFK